MKAYDALIIGGGHNGLVCAFYLARAGLKVRVFERRDVVGGAAVTEEFHPGFRNSAASYTVSLLRPKVIADMKLHERGLRFLERDLSNFFPFENEYLKLGGGMARTQAEFARFNAADAAAYPAYDAALNKVAQVLRDLTLMTPPNAGGGLAALAAGARQGWPIAKLPLETQRDLLDIFIKSARDFLDGWFEDDRIKSAFAFDAIVGNYAGVSTPGSAYVLLHHVFGEVNGKPGAWGHAVGGMGSITQAMAEAACEIGVEIGVNEAVDRVLIDGGTAVGVSLENGEEIFAKTIVANVGPALLYRKMVDPSDLPADFRWRMSKYKTASGTFRMNVALSELPTFTVLPGKTEAEHHRAGIVIAPSLDYMDAAYDDAKQIRLVPKTHRRDADPQHCRRQSRSGGPARRQPVLPAVRPRGGLGRASRNGRRPHHRHGRRACARLQIQRDRATDPFAARSGTQVRARRRRHFPRPHGPRPAMVGAAGAGPRRLPLADQGPLHVRIGHASGRRGDRSAGTQRGA